MATNSIGDLRRSPRLEKKPPWRSMKMGEISSVERLLETGYFEGVPITCFSEELGGNIFGLIKGSGFLCGCSQCNYKREVLSAKMFEKHAGANKKFQTDHIFFSNGMNLYEIFQLIRNIPEDDIYVKILKLRMELKRKKFNEEPPEEPIMRRNCKRKRKRERSNRVIRENDNQVKVIKTYIRKKRFTASSQLKKPFEASRQLFKCYRRYNPERRLIDVRGLLSTGLLEGFRVTYKRNEARLEAHIRGSSYECGCSSCNRTKVITGEELERHAREFSKNQNENIYLDCGMTLYKVVKELKGIPLCLLGNFLQEKIKCSPNYSSFKTWKGSFKMDGGSPNLGSNFGNQLEVKSKSCSVQCGLDMPGPGTVKDTNNTARSAVCKDGSNFVEYECHLGPASRKKRSPRIINFRKHFNDFNVVPCGLMDEVQRPVQRAMFEFSGSESTTTSDVTISTTEDPDYNPLASTSEKGWTCGEITSSRRILKRRGRNAYEHKRIFEEDGLPGETELTYQCCDKLVPSDMGTHAGMSQKGGRNGSTYNSDGKTLHESSGQLADIPKSSSVPVSKPGNRGQNKHNKRKAKPLQNISQDFTVSTRHKQKRVLQSQGVIIHCTICNGGYASLGDEADPNLIIFCNQCERAYHVGCLEHEKPFKIEDVFSGTWFCCTDCTWVDNSLKKICALGAHPVPPPFLASLKAAQNNPLNLSWQIFGGTTTEDKVLSSNLLKLIKDAFKPVLHGKDDIIQQLVFGNQVAGTGQDFRGMRCIFIKINEEIVSVALLRVFGKFFAELPLVMSPKKCRKKGYFSMLLSLIEELLGLLQVRLLVAPVHEKMKGIWIHKLGFVKASDQKVKMLKEQHGLISFEDTTILVKEIPVASGQKPN